MRSLVRISLLALVAAATLGTSVPSGAQASFGVERFFAANCVVDTCGQETFGPYNLPKKEISTVPQPPATPEALTEAKEQGFTQAGGRVPFGITSFKVKTTGALPNLVPEGKLNHIRTDVAPGLATSPAAVAQCTKQQFGSEVVPGTGFFPLSECEPNSNIGVNKVILYLEAAGLDLPLEGPVYNLEQSPGLASEFGVEIPLPKAITEAVLKEIFKGTNPKLEEGQYFAHTLIKGNVEWGKQPQGTGAGDYHDYFEIEVSEALPLISSTLVFFGTSGNGAFVTNGTRCPGHNTTRLKLNGNEGGKEVEAEPANFTTLIGLQNCAAVPFEPGLSLAPGAMERDEPVGFTTVLGVPQNPATLSSSQVADAFVSLPEGMTLNPSAAAGRQFCTAKQARINSPLFGTECPKAAKIGEVELEVPTLPGISLTGNIYLGGPESGLITGLPPENYTIYLVANSEKYGVSVRLRGETIPNPATGQVTTIFSGLPEQPFTRAILTFEGGALAPIASPLACGAKPAEATLHPFTEFPPAQFTFTAFTVFGCPASLPFNPTQSTPVPPGNAGSSPLFTLTIAREDGQQYLHAVTTELAPGLVAKIPAVKQLCEEPQAGSETLACPAESLIGSATVEAGAGPAPFKFSGSVYLTGPTNGAPYGLSIKVPALAGPFNFGTEVTRATISVNPYTGQVIVRSILPAIRRGVPLRLRNVTVAITKPNYLLNPTNCETLKNRSTLVSTLSAVAEVSTPYQVSNCSALAFNPSFKATSLARTSKANGASLETTINQPSGQANIKSVLVQLPAQLPSRLTTLQKACPEKTFEANPSSCPAGSFVGGARANTPVLPGKMQGPAILVSHGGEAFPDLDLVMEANGVRVILVGHTKITKAITTTNFSATPDVPVSSVTVNLPTGPHSALTANGNLCTNPLIMPTTITGQNGKQIKQNTRISVTSCPVEIVGSKVVGNNAVMTVRTYEAGRISGSGSGLDTVFRHLNGASRNASLTVPLSSEGLRRGRPFSVRVRVGFVPNRKGVSNSIAYRTVRFG